MKRILNSLLISLVILSTFGAAAAETQKAQHSKKKPVADEATLTALPGAAVRSPLIKPERKTPTGEDPGGVTTQPGPTRFGPPIELAMKRAGSKKFDLRSLPQIPPEKVERPELEEPDIPHVAIGQAVNPPPQIETPSIPTRNAPAPPTIMNFDGLDFANWGAGHPPDTNGDVGPAYYIQTINTSIGIFRKSDGVRVAAFTFNTFMSQGHFGNLCDNNNFGDPVVLYDSFEDRWIITDFAFQLSGNNIAFPPGNFQCVAASMSGDPVSGGWNFYSINTAGGLGDYPKFGIWPDGLYMSANMFQYVGGAFINPRVYAFNKAQMYAGSPSVQVVTFNAPSADFTVIPSNARLQAGTPPPGTPNYYIGTEEFLNALTVYKFHVNWNSISLSTFTGPDTPIASTSWPASTPPNAQSLGGNNNLALNPPQGLDVLPIRAMVQNQYTNLSGVESLWASHTVRRGDVNGLAAPRWYQVNVTGGTVNPAIPQAATWDPDGANVISRFTPSVAVDRAGDMALGYSTSNITTKPAVKYAGRLAGDPINTLSQTEQLLIQGTGTQLGNCGGANCTRWGDYSGMALDPADGCTFWMTNLYYAVDGLAFLTRIGSFSFPSCTPVGAGGTVTGTVTAATGGAPINGATVNLGARSTTTDLSGVFTFSSIPAGTYPTLTASAPGFITGTASSIVVTDGGTTTQNFSLNSAPPSACLTDTTQADFQTGVGTNVDVTTSPGDVILSNPSPIDQQNLSVTPNGFGVNSTSWAGQTFTPAVSGKLTRVDIDLFCSGCTGTTPNITVSIRATTGATPVPTGADLATATIPGFSSGSGGFFTANFGTPATLTAGTRYAIIIRAVSNPSAGTYAYVCSCSGSGFVNSNPYTTGQRVTSANSGATWAADVTSGGRDLGFVTYINNGFSPSGNLSSSLKDSNPAPGLTPIWSTFSWDGSTPANTSLTFQLAGSNSNGGPFNFVGPDGTAGTFFTTSPVQLSPQFYGFRYLQYQAILASTDNTKTPTFSDATACFIDTDCSGVLATITPAPAQVCAGSTGDTASGPAGMTSYSWGIANGTITSATNTQNIIYTAGASGSVTLSLTVVAPNGCIVSGSAPVTINPIPPAPTITPGGPTTFTYPGNVTLTSSSADTYQWYLDTGSGPNAIGAATNQAYIASVSGGYTVVITVNGCISAPSAPVSVVVNKATPVVTATGGTFTYNGTPQAGSGTATGGAGESLTVTLTYTGTGATTYGPSATAPTLVGTYSVVAHTDGDANNNAGDSAPAALTITMANPVIIATGGTFTYDGNPHAGSGSATGGGGEVLTVTLTYNGTGSTTYGPTATAPSLAGTYTVTAHTPGDANNNAGDSSATALTINKFNTLMAAFGGTVTYTGTPHAGSGQALGGAGEHLPVTLTYQGISGTTYGPSATPPTDFGVYLVTAHTVGDANNNAEDSLPNALRINKATATIVVTAYCAHFDGSAHTATGTATGVLGESLTGLDLSGTTHTAAGTYLGDAWTFSGSLDYSGANSTVDDSIVNAVITAPVSATTGTTGNVASVVNAGAGATYTWGITGGSITAGTGTNSITFTAGGVGTLTLNVTVTTSTSCSDAKSANTVVLPLVTVTSVSPTHGTATGDTLVTINGTSFASGATVTFGGTPATSVVVASSIKITARTPVHANGSVNVTVTNTDTSTGTLTSGYLYQTQVFDPNGDGVITSADIFFLVNYLFLGGPAPHGASGLLSGDANGDGVVDSADIFYIVNYLFLGGQKPNSPSAMPGVVHGTAAAQQIGGSITLGTPVIRGGHYIVPVIMTANENSIVPQSMALRAHFDTEGTMGDVTVRRAGAALAAGAVFEIDRRLGNDLSYLVSYDPHNGGLALGASRSAVVAEIEIESIQGSVSISIDPTLTMLSDQSGTVTATVGNGRLQVNGTTIGRGTSPRPRTPSNEVN
jgi:hypothetical protein